MASNTIQALKSLSIDALNIEETVELAGRASAMAATYEKYGVPTPSWLQDAQTTLDKEIRSKHRDMLQARLSEAKSRFDSLKTAEEKRHDLAAEIDRLTQALAK